MINEYDFKLKKNGEPYKNKTFCRTPELIENYDLAISDTTQTWICHHRNERFYSSKELIDLGLYYDCPPCELIFLTAEDHGKEYHKGKQLGPMSDEHKKRLSEAGKGKNKGNKFWLGKHHSEETKRKIAESHKGKTPWNKKH